MCNSDTPLKLFAVSGVRAMVLFGDCFSKLVSQVLQNTSRKGMKRIYRGKSILKAWQFIHQIRPIVYRFVMFSQEKNGKQLQPQSKELTEQLNLSKITDKLVSYV